MRLYFVVGTTHDRDMIWLFVRAADPDRAIELFRENVRTTGVLVTVMADELPPHEGEEVVIDPAGSDMTRAIWALPIE